MSWRPLPRLRRSPGHAPTLVELDHLILAHRAITGARHGEQLTDVPDSLPGGGLGQVAVIVPARPKARVGDELEDPPSAGDDFPACTCDARNTVVIGHVQHPSTRGGAARQFLRLR